jgi:hypothetical protein
MIRKIGVMASSDGHIYLDEKESGMSVAVPWDEVDDLCERMLAARKLAQEIDLELLKLSVVLRKVPEND